ncbi:MAG: glucose-1-phosphate cytidylyltransferase [Candidatus Rokubacteria bacterium]|nr:glucose-1-phosphate cytidylyltransferase [Candidatus Rokubacteria bacterium]
MPVVILCGGKGTRLKEQTDMIPKPLIEIGGKPILWHIMKLYSHHGFNHFILCLGYLSEKIKEFFMQYNDWRRSDLRVELGGPGDVQVERLSRNTEHWSIVFAETGEETNTGGRIKRIQRYIRGDEFLATYGDGVADIDLGRLLMYHREKGKVGTVSVLHPVSGYGILDFEPDHTIVQFQEKPRLDIWINGGFFVFHRRIFEYLTDDCILEKEPFERLAKERQLAAYPHPGFWASMDTYKDFQELNRLWVPGNAPWKVWHD